MHTAHIKKRLVQPPFPKIIAHLKWRWFICLPNPFYWLSFNRRFRSSVLFCCLGLLKFQKTLLTILQPLLPGHLNPDQSQGAPHCGIHRQLVAISHLRCSIPSSLVEDFWAVWSKHIRDKFFSTDAKIIDGRKCGCSHLQHSVRRHPCGAPVMYTERQQNDQYVIPVKNGNDVGENIK